MPLPVTSPRNDEVPAAVGGGRCRRSRRRPRRPARPPGRRPRRPSRAAPAARSGSRLACSVCATRACSAYRRAFWTAVAARSARSWAKAKSSSSKRRPLSEVTKRERAERRRRPRASGRSSPSASRAPGSPRAARGPRSPARAARPGSRGAAPAARRAGRRDAVAASDRAGSGGAAPRPCAILPGSAWASATCWIPPRPSGQVDRAPVGQPRHGELRDPLERLLVVEAGGQHLAGLGEEALAQLGLLGLGDVLDDVHREGAALVLEQRGLRQQPVALAGGPVDAAREQLRRGLAGDEPAAREVLDRRPARRPRR